MMLQYNDPRLSTKIFLHQIRPEGTVPTSERAPLVEEIFLPRDACQQHGIVD